MAAIPYTHPMVLTHLNTHEFPTRIHTPINLHTLPYVPVPRQQRMRKSRGFRQNDAFCIDGVPVAGLCICGTYMFIVPVHRGRDGARRIDGHITRGTYVDSENSLQSFGSKLNWFKFNFCRICILGGSSGDLINKKIEHPHRTMHAHVDTRPRTDTQIHI